jgi:hypothetical protein
MEDARPLLTEFQESLASFPQGLEREFEDALKRMAPHYQEPRLRTWANVGLSIARQSLRSWEAALEYFRASPAVISTLEAGSFRDWAAVGNDLTVEAPPLAAAYFRASPQVTLILRPDQLDDWANVGRALHKGNWKSSALAAQFFEVSPILLQSLTLAEGRQLVRFIEHLSVHSYELASACLGAAQSVMKHVEPDDRGPFIRFAAVLADTSWADTRVYFDRGPALLQKVHHRVRERFLALSAQVAHSSMRHGYQQYADAAEALGELEPEDHSRLV